MEEARELLDHVLYKMYEILEKDLTGNEIHKMSSIGEVLKGKTIIDFYEMVDEDDFYMKDEFFYITKDGKLISGDAEDISCFAEKAFEDMEYKDQLNLIKRAVDKLERD